MMTILGILISAFIMEDGGRELDGNFLWQNTICSFLLFFSTISFLITKFFKKKRGSKVKEKITIILFFLHSISGFIYLIKIALTFNYN